MPWAPSFQAANQLSETHLAGKRSPSPLNVIVLRDDSGSFAGYEEMRDNALGQVMAWAPDNLRDDDTITVISFAETATVTLAPMTVKTIDATRTTPSPTTARDGRYTNIVPALALASDSLSGSSNQSSVIVITDTLIQDAASTEIDRLLRDLNVISMSVILPSDMAVDPAWSAAFGWEAEFRAEADDPEGIALAVGRSLAHATNQRLETERGRDVTDADAGWRLFSLATDWPFLGGGS
jgi:hypothetical protein